MPDGAPPPPAITPDLLRLMKVMDVNSKVVDKRLSKPGATGAGPILEIASASPSILDKLVEARARTEAPAPPSSAPPGARHPEPEPEAEPEPVVAEPEPLADDLDDTDTDLLDMVASEAGQPPAADPSPVLALIEELPEREVVETRFEADELLAVEPPDLAASSASEVAAITPDAAASELEAEPALVEGDELPSRAFERVEPEYDEGPGDDFQALLAGARLSDEAPARPTSTEDDDIASLLPASAEVRLRARNGPKPGAEFSGKSTLAGARGVYCLIERFDLPTGTRMKVTLMAPRFDDHVEVQDAVISRVRKAPGDAAEVQLAFEQEHSEVEEFVDRHFGDKPGFSFFGRRRR